MRRRAPPDDPVQGLALELSRIRTENARLLKGLAEGEKRIQLVARSVLRVQERERGRIARELHDGIGSALTAFKMHLELLQKEAQGPLAARLAELCGLAAQTLDELRQISRLLRPQMLDELGLVPTLRWLARSFQERIGLSVRLVHEGLEDRPGDADVETLVYRVAQEALTNVAKHARAQSAEIRVRRRGARLWLRVEDDGVGCVPAAFLDAADRAERGFGIRGMRDRVQLFGGRFSFDSTPGAGSVVEVELRLAGEGSGGS